MTPKAFVLALIASMTLSTSVGAARAADIFTPAIYVDLDQRAREITLEGMSMRLELLQSGNPGRSTLRGVADDTRQRVSALFAERGYDAVQHAAWGQRNADEIKRWLDEHPDAARRYRELKSRLDSLSAQLDRVR